jgi:uncharacterized phage protein (TIGR01671 family)
MREIEFRGKRTDIGHKWCYGNLQERNGHFSIYEKTHFSDVPKGYYVGHNVIPETVGQWIGLTDKNGAKIFEGDILLRNDGFSKQTAWIGWNEETGGFSYYFRCKKYAPHTGIMSHTMYGMLPEEYEIIGNIHDAPELLPAEEEEE